MASHALFAPIEMYNALGMRTPLMSSWRAPLTMPSSYQDYRRAVDEALAEKHERRKRLLFEQHHKWWTELRRKAYGEEDANAAPMWKLSGDEAELSLKLPAFEDGSLSAQLSADGRSLKVIGTARTEGAQLAEIHLPFGPAAATDVELVEQPDGKLSVRTTRKLPELDIKIAKPSPSPPPDESLVASPLIEAASKGDVEAVQVLLEAGADIDAQVRANEEKALEDKFKAVAGTVAKQVAVTEKMKDAGEDAGQPMAEN